MGGCAEGYDLLFVCEMIFTELMPLGHRINAFVVVYHALNILKGLSWMGQRAISTLTSLTVKFSGHLDISEHEHKYGNDWTVPISGDPPQTVDKGIGLPFSSIIRDSFVLVVLTCKRSKKRLLWAVFFNLYRVCPSEHCESQGFVTNFNKNYLGKIVMGK